MGFICQEAVHSDSLRSIRVWFTSSIPVSSGPAGYGGLPGMIIQVDINNGKRVITATRIDPLTNPEVLVKPKEGKKVTTAEYKKIVDDKMKEMGDDHGEGTNHVIIRYRN
jgi:GLPGLI family protein